MANASARDYFVENLVQPLATAPMIDGIFYDAFNYGYDIPEVTPWGLQTVNVPGCSKQGGAGCDALLEGSIDVAVRTAKALNAHGKVPMYANPGTFLKPVKQNIWMNESKLVEALEGTSWMTYYESARAESMLNGCPGSAVQAGWCVLDNLLKESKLGVAAGVHTYYQHVNRTDPSSPVEDPLPHMAAFMLARVRPVPSFPALPCLHPPTQRCGLFVRRRIGITSARRAGGTTTSCGPTCTTRRRAAASRRSRLRRLAPARSTTGASRSARSRWTAPTPRPARATSSSAASKANVWLIYLSLLIHHL